MKTPVEISAMAINVVIPEALRWRDTRRDEEFELQSLTIRMLPDGSLAAKAYGRPVAGGRGAYVSFAVPDDRPELADLISSAAGEAGRRWSAHSCACAWIARCCPSDRSMCSAPSHGSATRSPSCTTPMV